MRYRVNNCYAYRLSEEYAVFVNFTDKLVGIACQLSRWASTLGSIAWTAVYPNWTVEEASRSDNLCLQIYTTIDRLH